ncbi:MAG: hypothetical protein ACRCWO_12495 [Bosea sp. (in: a-proteobacteria)]
MMTPQQDDPDAMTRDMLLVGTVGLSLLNGMHFSPWFEPVHVLLRPILASFYLTSPLLLLYFTSIFLGLVTLMLAGIPASLFEKMTGRERSSPASMGIWMAVTLLLSIPALLAMSRAG